MDQLLELQRLSLEKDSELSSEEHAAMSKNIQLFLSNQQQYQALDDEMSTLNEQLIDLQQRQVGAGGAHADDGEGGKGKAGDLFHGWMD